MTRTQWAIIGFLVVGVVIVFCIAIAVVLTTLSPASTQFTRIIVVTATPPSATATPRATATPAVAEILKTGKPSYAELCDVAKTANLTSAQGKAYIDQLKNTRVVGWKRYVYQVDSLSFLGSTSYQVLLSDTPDVKTYNIQVNTSAKNVLSLSKGDLWEFSGKITDGGVYASGGCGLDIDTD